MDAASPTPTPSTPPAASSPTEEELRGWFAGRLPEGLFSGLPEIAFDRDEILVVGSVADVDLPAGATDSARTAARRARISRLRQETRERRVEVAREAERLFGRKVSWGAECGGVRQLFTTAGVPVMTRLRLHQRRVLDTLVDAGVARSRSDALAWCVQLVGSNEERWISSLRDALGQVERVRLEGPSPA